MKTSDITDQQVLSACIVSRGFRLRSSFEVLLDITDAPQKVALRAMERADRRGLIDWGVSIEYAWPAREGDRVAEEYMDRIHKNLEVSS
jgi:hypothetical protein